MLIKRVRSLFNSDLYHGWGRNRSFFEGWYFKIVNSTGDKIYAIIPGVSIDKEGRRHSFIQLLDGIEGSAEYYGFPFEKFKAHSHKFEISIENNLFTRNSIYLDLPGFKAKLEFRDLISWPSTFYSPGIMGPYTFAPFMECYHGILSLNHSIKGRVIASGTEFDFEGGRGYTEKDWGKSFPKGYIWLQSNHFKESGTSLKLSIACIPWLGTSFTGFIAGLLLDGKLYKFTTYNSSKLINLDVTINRINILIKNKNQSLRLEIDRDKATRLAAPLSGAMSGHISETMQAYVNISLMDIMTGEFIYSGKGENTALEVAGDIKLLNSQ
jgi:hypothetical protein